MASLKHFPEDRIRNARKPTKKEPGRHAGRLAGSNAELEAFAHTVAHDLREPLRTICAFTELLVRKTPMDEDGREIAGLIVNGVARMSALLDDLVLSASSGCHDPRDRVDLVQAAGQAIRNLGQTLTASDAMITVEPLPIVQGNESDLVRLFQNLIANAVKYRSKAAVEIIVTAERSGPDWVIKIKDNGIGIAPEHHRRVFGLFTRLPTHDVPGTGVGLAVCKKIVDGLGGTIWVESALGAGSTFCFTMPASKAESGITVISDADQSLHRPEATWRAVCSAEFGHLTPHGQSRPADATITGGISNFRRFQLTKHKGA